MSPLALLFKGNNLLIFVFVSVLLAGAGSWAAGRAAALGWKSVWLCAVYGALLGLAAGFLHYALFQQSVIPLAEIAEALFSLPESPAAALSALAGALSGFAVEFLLQTAFAVGGYLATRQGQMARQYGFARRKSTA